MTIKITSKQIKSYEVRNNGEWATVVIELGEKFAQVIAHSSFGEYAYTWNATGDNPLGFLKRISFDYAMTKFRGNYSVYDRDAQESYLKNEINEYVKNNHIEENLKDDYFEQAEDICGDATNTNSFMMLLEKTDLLNTLFDGDYSCIEIKTKPDPQCVGFWEEIWKPLIESIEEVEIIKF